MNGVDRTVLRIMHAYNSYNDKVRFLVRRHAWAAFIRDLPPPLVFLVRSEEWASALENCMSALGNTWPAANSFQNSLPSSPYLRGDNAHLQESFCERWLRPSPRLPAAQPAPGSQTRLLGTRPLSRRVPRWGTSRAKPEQPRPASEPVSPERSSSFDRQSIGSR